MKLFKLIRYSVGLFSALYLCANTSYGTEYGVGIIKIRNGPLQAYLISKDSEEKHYTTGEDPDQKTVMFEWQVTNTINKPNLTIVPFQKGDKSYVYKNSEVYSNDDKLKLVSVAGVYQKDNDNFAIAYKLERIQIENDKGHTDDIWRFTYIDPFDTTTPEGQKRLMANPFIISTTKPGHTKRISTDLTKEYTDTQIFARVDYKFKEIKKIQTVYSINSYNPDNITEKNVLDDRFKFVYKNLKLNSDLENVVIDIGRYAKIQNATLTYCVFDVNENKDSDPELRYVYWAGLDQPEWAVNTNIHGEITSIKKYVSPAVFDMFYLNDEKKEILFSIYSINTNFKFEIPKVYPTKEMVTKLEQLKMPKKITSLGSFKYSAKKSIWLVNGQEKNNILKEDSHYALCYSWRSAVTSVRADQNTISEDFEVTKDSIEHFWRNRHAKN
ncbi:MAG: hypothetical protein K0R49_688 [Burkholderiales bacterium]|jgi:hypothetical protein|nr:hypothetical protein [Burkholderiales bacterium]